MAKSMMCISNTFLSFNLGSLIYSYFILDHLKSYINNKLNFSKNLFRKLYYSQLISNKSFSENMPEILSSNE